MFESKSLDDDLQQVWWAHQEPIRSALEEPAVDQDSLEMNPNLNFTTRIGIEAVKILEKQYMDKYMDTSTGRKMQDYQENWKNEEGMRRKEDWE